MGDRYRIIRCEAEGCEDLAVIWDNLEEQVIDVISASMAARYATDDTLIERTPNDHP